MVSTSCSVNEACDRVNIASGGISVFLNNKSASGLCLVIQLALCPCTRCTLNNPKIVGRDNNVEGKHMLSGCTYQWSLAYIANSKPCVHLNISVSAHPRVGAHFTSICSLNHANYFLNHAIRFSESCHLSPERCRLLPESCH